MSENGKRSVTVRRLLSFFLASVVFFQAVGMEIPLYAAQIQPIAEKETVSRLEWLQALIETFSFSVEENNYPDNYYSDISSESQGYRDIMVATEFGLVGVEAGEEFRPNDDASREFAAHTLNLCLGYVSETEEYTFSEAGSVSYPEDIQIAIDQGWFAVEGQNFLPEQAVTTAEKDAMIASVKKVLEEEKVYTDGSHYTFREDVTVLPEETEVVTLDESRIAITDCPEEIKEGDIFGKVFDGMPLAWKAVKVETDGNKTIVTIGMVDSEEAFAGTAASGEMEFNLAKLQPASENETFRYVVGGSEEENYEDGEVFDTLKEVGDQEITAILVEQKFDAPASYDKPGASGIKLNAKITDAKRTAGAKRGSAYIDFSFKVDFTLNISADLLKEAGIPSNYELFTAPLAPGIYVKGFVDLSLKGTSNIWLSEYVKLGFHYENGAGRLVREFKKDSFTITADAAMRAGVRMEAGFMVPGLNGKIYGKMGAQIKAQSKTYSDGQEPASCQSITSFFYASAGYDVTVDVVVYKGTLSSGYKDIYTEYNSPVRVAYHYENGKLVPKCTRGTAGMGYAGYGYFSPVNSPYYYAGNNSSSTGTDGQVYQIFDYTLDEENQAEVTGYHGTAVNVLVPETLDGYTVSGIDDNAFENNKKIRSVAIADSVTSIGSYAFSGCTALEQVIFPENEAFTVIEYGTFHGCVKLQEAEIPDSVTEIENNAFWDCSGLSEVKLPKHLEYMGSSAFGNCDRITQIEIPKSLKSCGGDGPFEYCDGLKAVAFEEGTTEIASSLFERCTGLEEIVIPDTVTIIESSAFYESINLRNVKFSSNLTTIELCAFMGCEKLEKAEIPDSVTEIENNAFSDCSGLSEVKLPKHLEHMGGSAFGNCDRITQIEIPKSLKSCGGDGPFEYCDGLKAVAFEEGTTEIASSLFWGCTGLEEIAIPDTVTIIESYAFYKSINLRNVKFSSNLTEIEDMAFSDCEKLEKVEIPDSVTEIENAAFSNCSGLSEVKLPKHLEYMGGSAFGNCDRITQIEIPKSLKSCSGYGPFEGCDGLKAVAFEEGTMEIANSLFERCTGLEEIVIPDTVTIIESCAFERSINLRNVKFSSNLTEIEDGAFRDCEKLEKAEIPDGVTKIWYNVFSDCIGLKEAYIPDSVAFIGDGVFSGCKSLVKVHIPAAQKSIVSGMFSECSSLVEINLPDTLTVVRENAFYNCDALVQMELPAQLKEIGNSAFYDCDALTKVAMPSTLMELGSYAFYHCDSLAELTLGSGLTVLPDHAFALCPKLTDVVLPYRMAELKDQAFNSCTGLKKITIPRSVTKIGSQVFSYPGRMTIYGVSGTYAETYAAENGIPFVSAEKKAQSAALSQTEMKIRKGDSDQLFLTVTPGDFTDNVVWKSSNPAVAAVTEDGVVKGVSCGNADIRVNIGDVTVSCQVTVVQPVTRISLSESSVKMAAGETLSLKAHVYPEDAADVGLQWESSDPSVVSVNDSGEVKALAKGKAVVTAAACDGSGVMAKCEISVISQMFIAADTADLQSEHPYKNNCSDSWLYTMEKAPRIAVRFSAKTEMENGFDYIHLFDGEGVLIGTYTGTQLAGETVIVDGDTVRIQLETDEGGTAWGFAVDSVTKAEASETKQPDAEQPETKQPDTKKPETKQPSSPGTMTKIAAVTGVSLNRDRMTLEKGKKAELAATVQPLDAVNKKVTWSSSNPKVVSVAGGVVTAVSKGTAVITVTTEDGSKTAVCKVTVIIPAKEIFLLKEKNMVKGEKYQLSATIVPEDAVQNVTWKSSNKKIVKVDSKGKITALKAGTANITAVTENGKRAVCKVTVASKTVKAVKITLNKKSGTLKAGEKLQLTAKLNPSKSTDALTWKSSNKKIAKVDKNGVVTAQKPGKATITVQTKNGKKAICKIVVKQPAQTLKLNKTDVTVKAGKTLKLKATMKPSNTTDTLKWKSSNEKIVTVSQKGVVKGVRQGKATITAKTSSGKRAVCKVTVK